MAVVYHEKERIFKLDTPNTSYIIGIVDKKILSDMCITEKN